MTEFKFVPVQQEGDTVLIVYCKGCGHIVGCVYRPISEEERQQLGHLTGKA
jgi:hypothetical protein